MTTRVRRVEDVRPKMTVRAMGVRISAPSPRPRAMGSRPRMVVAVVMRMGRRRTAAAVRMASRGSRPRALEGIGVVDEDDGVVDDDAGEEDEAEEDHDRRRSRRARRGRGQAAEEGEGNADHDDERLQQGLELGGHDDVDEEQAEAQGEVEAASLRSHSSFWPVMRKRRSGGQGSVGAQGLVDLPDGAAQGTFGQVGLDQGHAAAVDAADFAGAFAEVRLGDGAQGDGLFGAGIDDRPAMSSRCPRSDSSSRTTMGMRRSLRLKRVASKPLTMSRTWWATVWMVEAVNGGGRGRR
jgi:hypothetical protein